MKNTFAAITAVHFALALTGCNSNHDEHTAGPVNAAQINAVGHETYATHCEANGSSTSENAGVEISGNLYTLTNRGYAGVVCAGAPLVSQTTVLRVSRIGSPDPAGSEVDFTLMSDTVVIPSTALVDQFNRAKYCDVSDWSVNRVQDIAGQTCGGTRQPAIGAAVPSRMTKAADQLRLGFPEEETLDLRPATLNSEIFYRTP